MGSHRSPEVERRSVAPHVVRSIRVGALLVGLVGSVAIAADWMASRVDEPRSLTAGAVPTDRVDDVGARGGRFVRAVLPTIVPLDAPVWEPAKGPVIVDGQPLPTSSPPRTAAPSPAAPSEVPLAAGAPAPAQEPAPVVGLPPVVGPPPAGGPSTLPPDPVEQTPTSEAPSDPPPADVAVPLVGAELGREPAP